MAGYPSPITSLGAQSIFGPDGELALARAAGKLGVPFICSTAYSRSMEAVARANEQFAPLNLTNRLKVAVSNLSLVGDLQPPIPVPTEINSTGQVLAPYFFQLYWALHNARPHDLERSYLPFGLDIGIEIGRTDPVFMKMHNRAAATTRYLTKEAKKENSPTTLKKPWLASAGKKGRKNNKSRLVFGESVIGGGEHREWEGPVVLKGIQSVADAETAVETFGGRGREGGLSLVIMEVPNLVPKSIRLDVLVELIRVTNNPQTFHQALPLIANLTRLAPESVLHNIMPIFTLMGSNIFHRDDSYSFAVV
ncbi:hypothetical protein D9758_008073 [Tetrapyrgos nigripes]|uniref:U3 small nucleolar RNA-associated protein 10 n=1 Tax=Tetrapyrgos nigripes TaxID=182062 RepID=A0A8H5D264_9AGAR|nr:hypothetical protein D9758_008073 [Tetrapyrgos nigripes]